MTDATTTPGAILLYHRVGEPGGGLTSLCLPTTRFQADMRLLKEHFWPVSLNALLDEESQGSNGSARVAVTFDDGYVDNLLIASPILEDLGIPATFFVTTADLDRPAPFWWDMLGDVVSQAAELREQLMYAPLPDREHRLRDIESGFDLRIRNRRLPRPMTGTELCQLASRPGHTVAAHTVHHLYLPRQTSETVARELRASKSSLEDLLQRPVTSVAYPYGATSDTVSAAAAAAGFDIGVTAQPGLVTAQSVRTQLPRIEINADTDLKAALAPLSSR